MAQHNPLSRMRCVLCRYSTWALHHLGGNPGTSGRMDPVLYHYAISPQAQEPNRLEEGYSLTARIDAWKAATHFVET